MRPDAKGLFRELNKGSTTRSERLEQMLAHVAAQEQSGQSRKAYGDEHGLSVQSLIYWSKRKRQIEAAEVKDLAAVEVIGAENVVLQYPNGVRLPLPANTSLDHVAACIRLY